MAVKYNLLESQQADGDGTAVIVEKGGLYHLQTYGTLDGTITVKYQLPDGSYYTMSDSQGNGVSITSTGTLGNIRIAAGTKVRATLAGETSSDVSQDLVFVGN